MSYDSIKTDRRSFVRTGVAAGVMAATGMGIIVPAHAAPKNGGTLRLGIAGANTSDNWDARTHSDTFMIMMGQGAVFDCLTEVGADGKLKGELAESWESSADAKTWTFNLRKGVTFHNGKTFDADDVIASLQLHTAKDAKSAAKPIISSIVEMKKMNSHQIQLELKAGNADFPHLLSDYHLVMHPANDIEGSIAKGIGTGGYQVVNHDPGVRTIVKKYANHYKSDACFFDSIEQIAINDASARMNALMTNQVDAINRVDFKTEALLKRNPSVAVFEVTGNQHFTFPMLTGVKPYDNADVRMALKLAFDRQEMVDKILQGHGAVANDHPIGPANQYWHKDLAQREYDPEKAKALLKKAGMEGLTVDLSAANAAFPGALDAAQLLQASAKKAGINLKVTQEPDDGYWSNVWLKKAWCACYWSGRATEDWMFSSAYERGVPWNDTGWDNQHFQDLLLKGRSELDSDKRRVIYHEMQELCSNDGGTAVPMYANFVDAHSKKLTNSGTIGNIHAMDSSRIAKRWWFA